MNEKITKDDIAYKIAKRNYTVQKKKHDLLEAEIKKLRAKQPDMYKLEDEMSKLAHKYKRGDIIVLKAGCEMAEIRELVGRKHYKLFVQCKLLRSGLGTHQTVHERDILCHAMDLVFKRDALEGMRTYGKRDEQ